MSKDSTKKVRKLGTPLQQLLDTNEFLINQNIRLTCKRETAKARLIVACVFLFAETLALTFISFNGGFY